MHIQTMDGRALSTAQLHEMAKTWHAKHQPKTQRQDVAGSRTIMITPAGRALLSSMR